MRQQMMRLTFLIKLTATVFALCATASETRCDVSLAVYDFDVNAQAWASYEYTPGVNTYHPANWERSGGVGNSGYIWTDDTMWNIDTPENPHQIFPMLIYRYWPGGGEGTLDLRGAKVSVYLRGDNLDLKGGHCYFWAFNGVNGTRWEYTGVPLTISNGSWAQKTTILLNTDDPSLWTRTWSRNPDTAGSIDDILAAANSYGFAFVGMSSEVTGRLSMDSLVITVPEPGAMAMLISSGLALLATTWRRNHSRRDR